MYNMETILEETMIKILNQSATQFKEKGEYEQAKRMYFNALRLSEKLLELDKDKFLPILSKISKNIAIMYEEVNLYDLAIKYYKQSIFFDKKVSIVNLEKIANIYFTLGNLCRRDFRYRDSERYYNKALNIYLDLPVSRVKNVEKKVINIYHHLSIVCSAMGKVQEAKESYMNLLNIYKDLVTDEDDSYKPELAVVLFNLGTLYFKNNRRNKSSEVYLFALELLLYLDSKDSHSYKDMIAHTLHNLGQIYTEQHDYPAALSAYKEALNHFIELADDNPSRYGSEVALVFKNLALFYKKQNRMDLAEYFHLRQIELYRELNHYNTSAYDFVLASAIIEGVEHYGQHSITLYEAEAILRSYEDEMQVEKVLEKICMLREEMSYI